MIFQAIDETLDEFRSCFKYKTTFVWFLVVIMGFIIRFDHLGVTSFVRWLFLVPNSYELILNFFRTSSWDLGFVLDRWANIAVQKFPRIEFNGRALLIGDGIKISKEAKKMTGVKSLHQDSENSGKAKYIMGHHFNFVGMLVGKLSNAFCLPLQGRLHEGVDDFRPDKECSGEPKETLVTRMVFMVVNIAKKMGLLSYVVLDAYFATGPAFRILLSAFNTKGEQLVHLITRAKSSYVGYHFDDNPNEQFSKKNKVKLMDVFDSVEFFKEVKLMIYGELKTIKFYSEDLIWRPINDFVCFVYVKDGDQKYVLMCSDLKLNPLDIITIYSYRWKIETMFLHLKHLLGGFLYHFWSKLYPKLELGKEFDFKKINDLQKEKLSLVIEAIERFVNLAAISLGILQLLAIKFGSEIWKMYKGWLRTYSTELPSEGVVQSVIQMEFFASIKTGKVPVSRTLNMIMKHTRLHHFDQA